MITETQITFYVVDEVTGEEHGPYETSDAAHDNAPVPTDHTFRIEERESE